MKETIAALQKEISELKKQVNDLNFLNSNLTIAYNVSKIGMWDWDVVNNSLVWDDQMYVLYGIKKENFSGAFDAWVSGLHPDDKVWGEAEINLALEDKKEWNPVFRVLWPDGSVHYIRATGKVFWDDTKKPIRMLGLNWDVTKEYETEELLKNYNHKLNEKNKELNEFTYIASHDLQEPINTITSFSDLLLLKYKHQLDDEAQKYLTFIKESGLRSRTLISNLLDYSRLGKDRVLETIDINTKVENVLDDLSSKITSSHAIIKIEKLPVLKVYPLEMRLLFQNLIGNALKFIPKGKIPEIHISCKEMEREWQFDIKDNGIGIPEKYQDKIFAVFRRLHDKNLYEGTGIGLAHCKKIAEMHGGIIRVESKPDEGSTFIFTISKTLK